MTDEFWIEKLKEGSEEALGRIIKEHKDYVYSVAFKMVRNRELAEEITQDVFVKVYNNAAGFRYESRFSTWLYTIVYRTSLNYLERHKIVFSESELSPERADLPAEFRKRAQTETGETNPEHFQLQEIIWRAVDRIPVLQGVVILLYYMNQFSVAEIAEVLQVPPNTVKTHLHRGRKALKNLLSSQYSQEELL